MSVSVEWRNMLGVILTSPWDGVQNAIRVIRTKGRLDEYGWTPTDEGTIPGGCGWMSEEVEMTYGWPRNGGCYIPDPFGMDGEPGTRHIAHYWNHLFDGRIIDATADQFRDGDDVRITASDDPRYLPDCDGETCDPA